MDPVPRQPGANRVRVTADPHSSWWHVRVDEQIRTHCRSYQAALRERERLIAEVEPDRKENTE
jgi:hypothetical protein